VLVGDNVVLVLNFILLPDGEIFVGQKFHIVVNFFEYLITSILFGILQVNSLSEECHIVLVTLFTYKCVLLSQDSSNVAIPLAHNIK
jgi:hypothetical protein